jgi:hypothetical protein
MLMNKSCNMTKPTTKLRPKTLNVGSPSAFQKNIWSMQNNTQFFSYLKPFKLWELNQIVIELKVLVFPIDVGEDCSHKHVASNIFLLFLYDLYSCASQKTTTLRPLRLLQKTTYSTFCHESTKSKETFQRNSSTLCTK